MNNIKQSFLSWLVFLGTVLTWFIGFAAYTNLPTQENWTTLNKDIWNEMITKVNTIWAQVNTLWSSPAWAIMAFYLTSCPSWWIAADGTNWTPDLRWAFIRWMNWNANWRDIVRTLWDYKVDTLKSHSHSLPYGPNAWWWSYALNSLYNALSGVSWYIGSTQNYWDNETSPKNIALLYCMKQ